MEDTWLPWHRSDHWLETQTLKTTSLLLYGSQTWSRIISHSKGKSQR